MHRKFAALLLVLALLAPAVSGGPNDPDLTVESISFSDDSPTGGDNVTLTATVANDGGPMGNQPVTTNVSFFRDGNLIANDTLTVPGGGTADAEVQWRAVGGRHNITAVVDPDDEQPESDEDNNNLSRTIDVAYPPVLVVDDDDGENNGGENTDTDGYYTEALDALDQAYDFVRVDAGDTGPDDETLDNYQLVIWFTGEDMSTTLLEEDQENLGSYLDNGNSAWITGQDILWDLNYESGERYSGDWEYDYLGVGAVNHDTGTADPVAGVSGDPVTDGAEYDTEPIFSDWADDVAPRSGSQGIFNSTLDNYSALRLESDYNLVFMAFEFAFLNLSADREDLAQRILDYLLEELAHDVAVTAFHSPRDGDTVEPDSTTRVNVTVRNRGTSDESDVQVNLDIDCRNTSANDHSDSTTIASLPAGSATTVAFDWDVPSDEDYEYDITVEAYLANDEKRDNDARSIAVDTYKLRNLAVARAVASPRLDQPDAERGLAATVTNPGDVTLTRDVSGKVYDSDDNLLYDGSTQEVTLAPGETTNLNWTWTPSDYGSFRFTAALTTSDEVSDDDEASAPLRAVDILFRDDMESGRNGWRDYSDTPGNPWHLIDTDEDSNREAASPTHAMWVGDETKNDGEYNDDWDFSVFTADNHSLGDNPRLVFQNWYDTEESWDGGNVQISTDGGETWEVIDPDGGYPYGEVDGLDGEPGYSGNSSGWQQASFDLSNYSNSDVRFRFRFGSDGSVSDYEGWYFDDVELRDGAVTTFSDDFEDGDGNWVTPTVSSAWQLYRRDQDYGRAYGGDYAWWQGDPATGDYEPNLNDSLETPMIDLGDGSEKYVSALLWFAIDGPYDGALVEINASGDWETLEELPGENGDRSEDYGDADDNGWLYAESDVSDYQGQVSFRVRFTSDSSVVYEGLYVDDVVVFSLPQLDHDVGTRAIDAPDTAKPGRPVDFEADIYNYGRNDESNFAVRGTVTDGNGSEVFNETRTVAELASGDNTTLTWTWEGGDEDTYTLRVRTLLDGDERDSNDLKQRDIDVRESGYAIALAVEEQARQVLSGESVRFNFTATNNGDRSGYYDLTTTGDGDGWFMVPFETSIYVSAGDSRNFSTVALAPTQAPTGTSRDFVVTVTSQDDPDASDSQEVNATAVYDDDGDEILLVDIDAGEDNGYYQSWLGDLDVGARMKQALADGGYGYDVYTVPWNHTLDYLTPLPADELLAQYPTVIWFHGAYGYAGDDESSPEYANYTNALRVTMDAGDGLWLLGQHLLNALNDTSGARAPGSFEYDYLKVAQVSLDGGTDDPLEGVAGDEITDGVAYPSGDRSIVEWDNGDWIEPNDDGVGAILAGRTNPWHLIDTDEDDEREAASPTHSMWIGDETKGTGEYHDNWDYSVFTADSYTLGANGRLNFQNWYLTEADWDGGNVQVSTDGGETWEVIDPDGGYPYDEVDGLDGEPGYSGDSSGWQQATFDLGNYSGDEVRFRYRFGTDGSVNGYEGWYFDDVELSDAGGVLFSDDFESGDGDWETAEGNWNATLHYSGDYRLVLSTFTFAFLETSDDRADLVQRVLDWLLAEGAAHDVGTRAIAAPASVTENTTVDFTSTIRNYGSEDAESFTVQAEALRDGEAVWSDSQTVAFLAAGDETDLDWEWDQEVYPGDYTLRVTTELASDENPDNDARTRSLTVEMVHRPDLAATSTGKEARPGDTITFTLTAANNASGRDRLELRLTRDPDGWGRLSHTAVTLDSDDSREITLTVEIPDDAQDGDYDLTVEAEAGGVSDSQTVTVTVTDDPTSYGVTLEVDENSFRIVAGGSQSLVLTITNTGEASDTIALSAAGDGDDWISFERRSVTLEPDESTTVTATIEVPAGTSEATYRPELRATSNGDDSQRDTETLQVEVEALYRDLSLRRASGEPSRKVLAPGASETFNLTLQNQGNADDTFALEVYEIPESWIVELNRSSPSLAAGETGLLTATVAVPATAADGDYRLKLRATSSDGETSGEVSLTVQVYTPLVEEYGLVLRADNLLATVETGRISSTVFAFELENTGNVPANVELDLSTTATFWQTGIDPEDERLMAGSYIDGSLQIITPKTAEPGDYLFTIVATIPEQGVRETLIFTVTVEGELPPENPPDDGSDTGLLPAPSLVAVLGLLGLLAGVRRRRPG